MGTEELEVEALKLAPQERARLAEKLPESLENLSEDENAKLWAEEAKVVTRHGTRIPKWAAGRRGLSRRQNPPEVIVSFHRLAEQELNEAAQYYEREVQVSVRPSLRKPNVVACYEAVFWRGARLGDCRTRSSGFWSSC